LQTEEDWLFFFENISVARQRRRNFTATDIPEFRWKNYVPGFPDFNRS
jgi:hypothetical protein